MSRDNRVRKYLIWVDISNVPESSGWFTGKNSTIFEQYNFSNAYRPDRPPTTFRMIFQDRVGEKKELYVVKGPVDGVETLIKFWSDRDDIKIISKQLLKDDEDA